jgi:hypothetical protein
VADQAELPGVDQAIPDVAGMWDYPGGSESTTPARPDHGWLRRWPLRSYLELGALDTAPGSARAHAGAVVWEWGLGDVEDDACLIVSELVTNAVLSARPARRPDPVRMWMLGSGAGVLFLVWDATMAAPVRRAAAPDAEHGRGLNIVDALSARWGSYHAGGRLGGKVVWAVARSGRAVRRIPVFPVAGGNRAVNRSPVAPHVLARVKAALERTPPGPAAPGRR